MVLLAIVVSISSGSGVHWLHLSVVMAEAVGFAAFMMHSATLAMHHAAFASFGHTGAQGFVISGGLHTGYAFLHFGQIT